MVYLDRRYRGFNPFIPGSLANYFRLYNLEYSLFVWRNYYHIYYCIIQLILSPKQHISSHHHDQFRSM